MKTSFILAVKLWSITSPEAWSRNTARQISLITINALSGYAGVKHCRRRVADAQITVLLQSRQNVVEVGRRRQPEDLVRLRVLMCAGTRDTKQKQDDQFPLAGRSLESSPTASNGVKELGCDCIAADLRHHTWDRTDCEQANDGRTSS